MKLPCRLIEDVLPLYHDGVCSKETREFVEEHVKECFECRMLLKKMESGVELAHEAPDDVQPLKNIRSEWLKTRKKALIKGAVIAIIVIALLLSAWRALTELTLIPVNTDDIAVYDLSLTSDGSVAFRLLIDDGLELREMSVEMDDESKTVYLTPKRAVIERRRSGDRYMSLNGGYFFVRMEAATGNTFNIESRLTGLVIDSPATRLCLGTDDDCVVLWEEGKNLPAATENVEAIYLSGR